MFFHRVISRDRTLSESTCSPLRRNIVPALAKILCAREMAAQCNECRPMPSHARECKECRPTWMSPHARHGGSMTVVAWRYASHGTSRRDGSICTYARDMLMLTPPPSEDRSPGGAMFTRSAWLSRCFAATARSSSRPRSCCRTRPRRLEASAPKMVMSRNLARQVVVHEISMQIISPPAARSISSVFTP